MRNTTKKIIIVFSILIIIKTILAILIPTPSIYTDEYIYIKMAQSFYQNFNLNIHDIPTSNYPPLYPILLSVTFFMKSVPIAYIFMKILNSIFSSLIIIPAFLLAKEFLDSKKALITSSIIPILPMNMVFPGFIMAENLFYTLFLTSIYLIYKSFTEKNYKYDILAGIFIGLSFLTKFSAISLIIIVLIIFAYKIIKRDFIEVKKKILMGLTSLMVISPWLIRNAINFGTSFNGITGQYSSEITNKTNHYYTSLFSWIIINLSYFLVASAIIILLLNFSNLKDKFRDNKFKVLTILTILTIMTIAVGAAHHSSKGNIKEETNIPNLNGRPIGRYLDTALPIIFLAGIITLYRFRLTDKFSKKLFLMSIPFVLISSQLLYFSLFPANNISLTLVGSINLLLTKIVHQNIAVIIITGIFLITSLILYLIIKNSNIKKLTILIILFILITNMLAFSAAAYNSKTYWKTNQQIQLSKWISENIEKDKTITIDKEYCGALNKQNKDILCTEHQSTALTALWILNPIRINSINSESDYIITKKKLNLKLIKETSNSIYLYENNN